MPRQLWIADAARAAGLTVVEVDGWRERGSSTFNPRGLVCHHTAGPAAGGDAPSLRTVRDGRSDLPGPLSQFVLGRSGTVYVVAAGRANHAGAGGWKGLSGNTSVFGIEAENNGSQPWPAVQLDAYRRLAAALARGARFGAEFVCGHKEWAPRRKPDPHSIDMAAFRARVAALLGAAAPPSEVPAPPQMSQEDDMARIVKAPDSDALWLVAGAHAKHIPGPAVVDDLRRAGVVTGEITVVGQETIDFLAAGG